MKIKDIKLYTVQVLFRDTDKDLLLFRTVAVGRPDFLYKYDEDRTEEQEEFDAQIFYYYDDYAELQQHLKDGFETDHEFIITKIINQ